jgi:threonine/homoserine/homoserine lactone efflux protein
LHREPAGGTVAARVTEHLLLGSGFAFAAAIQPGPLQAFLLAKVAERGWRPTLPAALAPLLSDGPIALLVLLVLHRLPEGYGRILQAAGGVLLLLLAAASLRAWRRGPAATPEEDGVAPRTLLQAAAVNILNPNPYLGWSLVLGPAILRAWEVAPSAAVVLVVAFYVTMVVTLAATIVLFGATRFLGPRGMRALLLAAAVTLAALGVYQLLAALSRA